MRVEEGCGIEAGQRRTGEVFAFDTRGGRQLGVDLVEVGAEATSSAALLVGLLEGRAAAALGQR